MRYKIEIDTACVSRVVNDLNRGGVGVQCVQIGDKRVCFFVQDKHCQKTKECLAQKGYSYRVFAEGLAWALSCLRRHLALWIVLGVMLAVLLVGSRFLLRVEIRCVPELQACVAQAVEDSRPIGQWASRYDLDALKEELVALDHVALVSLSIKGVCLVVDVKEELPDQSIMERQVAPIVASCDCIVSRIVVERGRAMVSEGQSVRAGDILIAPEYLLDKEQDISVPTEALGTVYGYAYPTASAVFEENHLQQRFSDSSVSFAVVSIAGQRMGEIPPSPYDNYQMQCTLYTLDSWLPVAVERVTYTEVLEEIVYSSWEGAKEEVIASCYRQIEAQLKNNVTILRKWCIINNMGSTYTVRAYAEVEQEVGIPSTAVAQDEDRQISIRN